MASHEDRILRLGFRLVRHREMVLEIVRLIQGAVRVARRSQGRRGQLSSSLLAQRPGLPVTKFK